MLRENKNAFDAIRLILAMMVVYTHAHVLGGFGEEGFARLARQQTLAGTFAVIGFFGVSGFLVTQSFVLRQDWRMFVKARLLRILPGLYLALILTAFLFAPAIAYFNSASEGWHVADAGYFVLKNAFIRVGEWHVGGVLSGLPYEGSINGSLWSLFPEFGCYSLILGLGLAGSLCSKRINLGLFVLTIVLLHFALELSPDRENLAPTLLSLTGWTPFVTAFLVGALANLFRVELNFNVKQAVFWWIMAAILLKFGGWALLAPIVLPLALIHSAYACRVNLPIDLSYGLYILHFPILHLASAIGINKLGFGLYFFTGTAVTALFALFSWFVVEKPALNLKKASEKRD